MAGAVRQSHTDGAPRNKGLRYPADPPKVEEIIAVMCAAGDGPHGQRLRGLIVILWRTGLRIQEALSLSEADLDQRRGSLLVRHGKGGRRREVGMDAWGWEQLAPLRLSRLRENARQAAAFADGRLGGPLVAWNRRARWRRLISPPTGPSVVIRRDNRLGGGRWCRRSILRYRLLF
ncbi:MAG: tyrosine-type recombinase/integrase [Solirubrobacterales bacterium]|nr:tyrosine-type recombinase/integrase [Solirubrobacterales bacterium]